MARNITPKDYVDILSGNMRVIDAPKFGVFLRFDNSKLNTILFREQMDEDEFFCIALAAKIEATGAHV